MNDRHRQRIAENWNQVVQEVADATALSGRSIDQVKIIGVTKYVEVEATTALVQAGCRDLGENRPQVLWEKAESEGWDETIRWHVIGHLQRNKVRRTLRHRPVIHSVDSPRLLEAIATESVTGGITTRVMLEVNISGEDAKTGMTANQLSDLLENLPPSGIEVIGLMAMAGWGTDTDEASRQFAAVRTLRDSLRDRHGLPLAELSMGMSGDFAAAIAEGATLVRIGSRLFEGVMDALKRPH